MYLVEGRIRPFLSIRCTEGKILPMLKSLTDKPISLLYPPISIICTCEFEKSIFMKGISRLGMGSWIMYVLDGLFCFSIKSTGFNKFSLLTDRCHRPGGVCYGDQCPATLQEVWSSCEKHKALFSGEPRLRSGMAMASGSYNLSYRVLYLLFYY